MPMTREQMVEKLFWNVGGYNFGQCAMLRWFTQRPSPDTPDLKSVVLVSAPADKYADDELAKLVEFSERASAIHDGLRRWRLGANLILLDKLDENCWVARYMSWESFPVSYPTLEAAIDALGELNF